MVTSTDSTIYYQALNALLDRVLDMLRFAEAKNAALLTFASAWIVGIANLLSTQDGQAGDFSEVSYFALPMFVVSATLAVGSLLPKLDTTKFTGEAKGAKPNYLFYGDIAKETVEGFALEVRNAYGSTDGDAPSSQLIADLQDQIAINSKIAKRKNDLFQIGAAVALIAVAAYSIPFVGDMLIEAGRLLKQNG